MKIFFALLFSFMFVLNADEIADIKKRIETARPCIQYNLYDKISDIYIEKHEYSKAILNYEKMIELFLEDGNPINIVNIYMNLAYLHTDYLKENREDNIEKGISYFEKAYNYDPETKRYEELLQNLVFFSKVIQDYEKAKKYSKIFIEKYSDSKKVIDFKIELGHLYLSSGKNEKAKEIFEDITTYNRKDSLQVIAQAMLGISHFKNGEFVKAKDHLKKSEEIVQDLIISGKPYARDYYMEALFYLSEIERKEFEKIELKLPTSNITQKEHEKNKLYKSIQKKYDYLLDNGVQRYGEVLIKKVGLLESFGDAKYNQELILTGKDIDDVANRKNVFDMAAKFYNKAVEEYLLALNLLDDFEKLYKEKLEREKNNSLSIISDFKEGKEFDSQKYLNAIMIKNAVLNDTIVENIPKTRNKVKNSISKMLYRSAEIYHSIAKDYVQIKSEYGKNSDKYFEKLYFIDTAVIPLIDDIIETHNRNIELAEKLEIKNEWIEESKEKISEHSKLLTNSYFDITEEIFSLYFEYFNISRSYCEFKGDKFKKEIGEKKLYNDDVFEEMISLVEYADSSAFKSVDSYIKTLDKTSYLDNTNSIKNNVLDFILKVSEEIDKVKSKTLTEMEYADSVFVYGNNNKKYEKYSEYLLECLDQLDNVKSKILFKGYDTVTKYDLESNAAIEIIYLCLSLKPSEFLKKINIETKYIEIPSNISWLSTRDFKRGFYRKDISTKGWYTPLISEQTPTIYNEDKLSKATFIISPESTTSNKRSLKKYGLSDNSSFFRKEFKIDGFPVNGEIFISADDSFILFVNGKNVIKSSEISNYNNWNREYSIDISTFLQKGENTVVLVVTDKNETNNGVKTLLKSKYIKDIAKNRLKDIITKK